MVEFQRKDFYSYEDFLEIMRLLRAPGGCPWDREQTHSSIRRNFLEETYEVLDAIDHDDASGMCEELGDVWPGSWCTAIPMSLGTCRRIPPSRSWPTGTC